MSLRCRLARWSTMVVGALVLTACTPTSLDTVRPSRFVAEAEVSQEARAAFGDRAEQAYDQLAELLLEEGFDLGAGQGGDRAAALVEPLAPAMTPDALDYWTRTARDAVEGDRRAQDVVDLLRITDLHDPELVARQVVSQEITDGLVDVADEDGSVVVELEQLAVVAAARVHRSEQVTVERSLSITLVEDGDAGWLLSEFEGDVDWSFEDE